MLSAYLERQATANSLAAGKFDQWAKLTRDRSRPASSKPPELLGICRWALSGVNVAEPAKQPACPLGGMGAALNRRSASR
jgi:hypothetical protein